MNDDMLRRYFNGNANEEEFKLCETLLEDAQTVLDEHRFGENDPLVASLRHGAEVDRDLVDDNLVQRIEGLVMRQSIGRDDLERLLDGPQRTDELGRIGKYRIIEFIAAGGMGLVFKAEDSELNRLVCIKIMHPALALKPDAKLRFERESRAAARLRSERIVTLLDIGVQRDLPYIVMQLLDGESLRSKLAREGRLPAELAVHYVTQIAEGLRHAHGLAILHRDIKPDNIWITPEGDIKLLDFGLAQPLEEAGNLTTTGGLVGTPQYMSPEQIQGKVLDARSDLFSVGIVLFEMLTDCLPFQKNNLFSTMVAITNDSVSLPASGFTSELDPNLANIVHGLLKKNAEERIQSADDLIKQLSQLDLQRSTATSSQVHQAARADFGARRSWSGRLRYVLTGLVGGLCMMLLGILLIQATNKGTLIIRTDDPQVEIQVAQETVTIKDPLSGRTFDVNVGKTVLSSGVYQLEMNDATSGLTFSASTIAIRRGETVIVEVALNPIAKVAGNKSTDRDVSVPLANSSTPENVTSADRSFDSKAREEFARSLERFAAMPATPYTTANSEIESPTAEHPKLAGIDSWSIETNNNMVQGLSRNSDGTLFAASRGNSVQIWDRSLKLRYTLPLARTAGKAQFDNKYPNLIAVSSYTKGLDDPVTHDTPSYELTVWRLGSDYAEVIYRIPCWQFSFAWDQGYRLFYMANDGVAAFRLDQGKAYKVDGPEGTILQNAISSSGRYLATGKKQNIDVWDLSRGEFAFTALGTYRAEWSQQGDRVAFFAAQRPAVEIWSLEKRTIDVRVELPTEPASPDRSGSKIAAIGLEPTFQRVAWLTPQGNLTVRNLQTNREDSQRLPVESKANIHEASIQWKRSSFSIETDQATFLWTHDKSDVQGTLKEQKLPPLYVTTQGVPLDFHRVLGSNSSTLCWAESRDGERNAMDPFNYEERQSVLYIDAFDTALNKFYREAPLAASKTFYPPPSALSSLIGPPFFSPDGKFATGPLPSRTPGTVSSSRSDILFYTLLGSAAPEKLNAPSATALWDKTSRFAFFVESGRRPGDTKFIIYDTEANQFIEEGKFAQAAGNLVDLQPFRHGFVACLRVDRPTAQADFQRERMPPKFTGALEVWFIDPVNQTASKATVATALLAKLVAIGSVALTDNHLFVSSLGQEDSLKNQVRKIHRIKFDDEQDSSVECVTVPVVDDVQFSPSGEYIAREARDVEVTAMTQSPRGPSRSWRIKGPSELSVARWSDVAQKLDNVNALEKQVASEIKDWSTPTSFKLLTFIRSNNFRDLRWHPEGDVAGWIRDGYPQFFVADKQELQTHAVLNNWEGLSPTDKGWSCVDRNEIRYIDKFGRPIGRLIFDQVLKNMQPTNPRWILADGSLVSRCSTQGLSISYLKENKFYCEAVDDFERNHPNLKLPRAENIPGLEP